MKITEQQDREIDIFREELFKKYPILETAVTHVKRVRQEYSRYEHKLPLLMDDRGLVDVDLLKKMIGLRASWLKSWIDLDSLPMGKARLVELLKYITGGQ